MLTHFWCACYAAPQEPDSTVISSLTNDHASSPENVLITPTGSALNIRHEEREVESPKAAPRKLSAKPKPAPRARTVTTPDKSQPVLIKSKSEPTSLTSLRTEEEKQSHRPADTICIHGGSSASQHLINGEACLWQNEQPDSYDGQDVGADVECVSVITEPLSAIAEISSTSSKPSSAQSSLQLSSDHSSTAEPSSASSPAELRSTSSTTGLNSMSLILKKSDSNVAEDSEISSDSSSSETDSSDTESRSTSFTSDLGSTPSASQEGFGYTSPELRESGNNDMVSSKAVTVNSDQSHTYDSRSQSNSNKELESGQQQDIPDQRVDSSLSGSFCIPSDSDTDSEDECTSTICPSDQASTMSVSQIQFGYASPELREPEKSDLFPSKAITANCVQEHSSTLTQSHAYDSQSNSKTELESGWQQNIPDQRVDSFLSGSFCIPSDSDTDSEDEHPKVRPNENSTAMTSMLTRKAVEDYAKPHRTAPGVPTRLARPVSTGSAVDKHIYEKPSLPNHDYASPYSISPVGNSKTGKHPLLTHAASAPASPAGAPASNPWLQQHSAKVARKLILPRSLPETVNSSLEENSAEYVEPALPNRTTPPGMGDTQAGLHYLCTKLPTAEEFLMTAKRLRPPAPTTVPVFDRRQLQPDVTDREDTLSHSPASCRHMPRRSKSASEVGSLYDEDVSIGHNRLWNWCQ